MKLISKIIAIFLIVLIFVPTTYAATFKNGENVFFSRSPILDNAYLAGDRIELSVPAEKDVVAAGGTLLFEGALKRSLMAAGGTITVTGPVTHSARIAGGTVTLESPVGEDLIVAGGTIRLTKNASVGGDLIITGGTIEVDAPVQGNVYANGGSVRLNSQIDGDVSGNMGQLTLGSDARVAGSLTYKAEDKAVLQEGAQIQGETKFTEVEKETENAAKAFISAGTIYQLIIDILFSLLFVLVLGFFTKEVFERIENSKLKNLGLGFSTLFLMPLAGLFLLLIVWLGLTWFVLYLLFLLLTLGLFKVYIGAKIMSWWEGRSKKKYVLDWKAAVVGPVTALILTFIPVLGWIALFILYLIALGGLVKTVFDILSKNTSRSPK